MIKPIIYFDLDGVLADFAKGVFTKTGVSIVGPDSFADKKLKDSIFADPNFFLGLELLPGAHDMIEFARIFGTVKILSATGYSYESLVARQKRAWVAEHFGSDIEVHLVPKSGDKAKFAWPDVVLIDDRLEKSVMPFRDKGGLAIHHTDPELTKSELRVMFK
jgi:5'(3')-deoxyribonucleotidase|tara:strand:+ start:8286 stop:8771 length:486 start_codon:yes stop_codon:yes gene_type:complete